MKKITFIALCFIIVIIEFNDAFAQIPASLSIESQQKARQVLAASVKAFGGAEAIDRAKNFSVKITGISYQFTQNYTPEAPNEPWPLKRNIVYEQSKNRLFHERSVASPKSDYIWWTKEIINNDRGWAIFVPGKYFYDMKKPALADFNDIFFLMPQNIIGEASRRNSGLRWLGNDNFKGRKQDVVAFSLAGGQVWNLFFDAETHLLTKYNWFYTRNVWGDTMGEFIFEGYQDSQNTKIPALRMGYQNSVLTNETKYQEIIFNPKPGDALYDAPNGLTKLNTVYPETGVIKLAPNVWLLRSLAGGFNVLAVEFADFVLVGETPEENIINGISAEAVELVKKTIPSKPIKYAVLTHHHGDHSSGLRAFVSEGASVITTPGNVEYVKSVANANFTFSPDLLTKNPHELKIETLTGKKRIISDSTNAVEIYEVGPIMHSREMLLIYLPKQKIIYQSDMYNPVKPDIVSTEDDPWHGINKENTVTLAEIIARLGLKVETIAGSHGRVTTIDEFVKDVEKLKANISIR